MKNLMISPPIWRITLENLLTETSCAKVKEKNNHDQKIMIDNNSKVTFRLDAIYYHSTISNLKDAKIEYPPLKKILDEIYKIDEEINLIEAKYEEATDAYDEVESLCIKLDSLYSEMSDKYKPVIEKLALVHILASLCLESFVNLIGKEKLLPKSTFDYFDSLTNEGKWYFLPVLLGNEQTFNKGSEPFQSFIKLVSYRNKLVHYKGQTDKWRSYLPPIFFKQLGLTIQHAEKSEKITRKMIQLLCNYCRIEIPDWITNDYWEIFEINI